jgi:hypothetical protein
VCCAAVAGAAVLSLAVLRIVAGAILKGVATVSASAWCSSRQSVESSSDLPVS